MFQEALLEWYEQNHRKLPWRETSDPYGIWLSEIMLQQTQVETVINYYNRFIARFPDVYALRNASEEEVFKLWEGLGYYSRAARLIPCARMVCEQYDGKFPKEYKALLSLPGIGDYTAGAISSIAFNQKVPAVDGNVMRVYSRLFGIEDDISKTKTKKVFFDKVLETLPSDRRHFNQALMELGAIICKPRTYDCGACPVSEWCYAKEHDVQENFPVKSKKIKKTIKKIMMAFVAFEDMFLTVRNDERAMLKGLWGFPMMETEDISVMSEHLQTEYDLDVKFVQTLGQKKHVFTHQVWEMTLVKFEVDERKSVSFPVVRWDGKNELEKLPWSTAQKKLWSLI